MLALAAPASAITPYVSGGIGFGGAQSLNGSVRVGAVDVGGFRADPGGEISGEIAGGGYFGRRLAAEIAFRYGRAELASATIAGQSTIVDTEIETLTVLARSRFLIVPRGDVRPFIGGGIGVQRVAMGGVERTGFAYEGSAGVTLTVAPRWDVDVAARYTGSTTAAFDAGSGVAVDGLRYRTISGGVTLRYLFGARR
ncbi:hypothetical protein IP88_01320 [alpha proteobacterium AAP81b]|nr:hypothetical protein IP88_01320 [alpha proteobacterium AAP81b]